MNLAQARIALANNTRALRVRNYRLYWFGQLVSMSGTWMQTTAQAWVVLTLTKSPAALGTVTTLQFLPIMLLSLFGGVIADRVQKRRMVLVTQTLALVQATVFGLLVGTGMIQVWHIYVLAAIQGVINAIDNPVRQAMASELVDKADRPNSIALNSTLFNAARIVGPALAGVLIASIGAAAALYFNALSFVAIIAAVLMMDQTKFFVRPPQSSQSSPINDFKEGVRYAWRTPAVLSVLIVVAFVGTFGYNFSVVLPLLGGFVLHTDAIGFGTLSASLGIGSLLGALLTTTLHSVSFRRLILGSLGFTILLGIVAVSTQLHLSQALLVGVGFCGVLFSTGASTLIQITVPDHLRGRVTSIFFLLFAGSTPIGASIIGAISAALNVSDAMLVCCALCLVGLGVAVWYEHRSRGFAIMNEQTAQGQTV